MSNVVEIAANKTGEQKKLEQARAVIKWMPFLAVLSLALLAYQCVEVAKHPGLRAWLGFVQPAGFALLCISFWVEARATIQNASVHWHKPFYCFCLLIMVSGPALTQMLDEHMLGLVFMFGFLLSTSLSMFLIMFAWEIIGTWNKKRRAWRTSTLDIENPQNQQRLLL